MLPSYDTLRARLAVMVSNACDGAVTAAEIDAAGGALADLGVTSLALLRLIDAIETEFGVAVDLDGDLSHLDSLDELTRYLSGYTFPS